MWTAAASSALSVLGWLLALVFVLVLLGALSQIFARSKPIDKPFDGDASWNDVSPAQAHVKRPLPPEQPRRASSSKHISDSPRSSRPEFTRQLSAPVSPSADAPPLRSSPRHAHLYAGRSSSSSSSVFEKAKKNWLLNLDDAKKSGEVSPPLPTEQSSSAEELRTPLTPSDGDPLPKEPLSPTSPGATRRAPSPTSQKAVAAFVHVLSFIIVASGLLALVLVVGCFDLAARPPAYSPRCPELPRPLFSLLSSWARGLAFSSSALFDATAAVATSLGNASSAAAAVRSNSSELLPPAHYAALAASVLVAVVAIGAAASWRRDSAAPQRASAPSPLTTLDFAQLHEGGTGASPEQQHDVVGVLVGDLEAMGLEVFRADPRGVQLPENVNLDNLERSQVFVLVLTRDEYARETCMMEFKLALERGMPLALLREAGARPSGPSELVHLVEATAQDPSVLVADFSDDERAHAVQSVLKLVERTAAGAKDVHWQVFVSHATRARVDSTLHRPVSPIPERGPVVAQPITTVRDSLAVLVAHVSDRESTAALSRLIAVQGGRGYLAADETRTLIAVLRAKRLLRDDSEDGSEVDAAA